IQYENEVNARWTMEYDARNRLIQTTDPLGVNTRYTYANNLLHSISTADETEQVLLYAEHHDIRAMIKNEIPLAQYRYDNLGNPVETIDAKGNHVFIKYDLTGKVTHTKDKDSRIRHFTHDPEGNLTRVNEENLCIQYSYTGLNRLKTKSENGECIHYRYNTEEKLISVINDDGDEYSIFYDHNLNVSEEIGFDGTRKRYKRDNNGNIIRIERDGGRYTCYGRDTSGNIIKVEHSDGLVEEYTYRADGEMLTARNNDYLVECELDKLGNVIKEKQDGVEINSLYDIHGNRKGLDSSLGAFQRIKRDAAGFVCDLYHGKQSHRLTLKSDQYGNELIRSVPGGVIRQWRRDNLGRPVEEIVSADHDISHSKQYFWKNLSDIQQITADGIATTFIH